MAVSLQRANNGVDSSGSKRLALTKIVKVDLNTDEDGGAVEYCPAYISATSAGVLGTKSQVMQFQLLSTFVAHNATVPVFV